MPVRLRPVGPIAPRALLVGDPGRALALAQDLLERPLMCNHARGLWGYTGKMAQGRELTVQSTGMGAPSATVVLGDLADLGVRRAIRIGTCTALDPALSPGDLLIVAEARRWSGGGGGAVARPEAALADGLRRRLGREARDAVLASLDVLDPGRAPHGLQGAQAADMQTAALLEAGAAAGLALAAVMVVAVDAAGAAADEEELSAKAVAAALAASISLE